MGEITKLVANRQSNASAVIAALEVHAKASAADVSAVLFPEGSPKHLTVALFIDALGKVLATHADAIGAADRALADELGDDQPYRDARDAARAEVRAALTDCQSSLSGAYGASVVHAYALDGALPVADNLLLQQARVVHAALAKGAPKVPAKKGRKLDFAALAEELEGHIAAFHAALQDVKREEREAEHALARRDAAVAAFEPVYTGIADVAAGLLELAGQGDLASRVKPTVRRRAGLDLPAVEPAPEKPGVGAAGTP
ncbi:MAG: hypothetical protein ABJE95_35835 [Byssovorax sp.]